MSSWMLTASVSSPSSLPLLIALGGMEDSVLVEARKGALEPSSWMRSRMSSS